MCERKQEHVMRETFAQWLILRFVSGVARGCCCVVGATKDLGAREVTDFVIGVFLDG